MNDLYTRSEAVFGAEGMKKLKKSHVLLFGVGGVGGHCAEALCRSGIGEITLVDSEIFDATNLNRQIFATVETVGEVKVEAAKKRLLSINPLLTVHSKKLFYLPGEDHSPLFEGVDFVIDAIDCIAAKLDIIQTAKEKKIPVISCMGTGNKLDPTQFRISDIYKTNTCPLAREVRNRCRKMGISDLKVVYSEEKSSKTLAGTENGRHIPGSVSFVPGVAGMILAGEVIKELLELC